MVVFRQKRLHSCKAVLFVQIGSLRVKLFYSGKSGCSRAKVVVFGQKKVLFGKKWLYSGKVVVFGQSGGIGAKVVV